MSFVDPILARESTKKLSKEQIRNSLDKHYDRLTKFVKMVTRENSRSLIVNGDAGMGKTEFTTDIIESYAEQNKVECGFISGTLSAVELYCRMFENRKKGQVLVIDDTDKILENTESLEVLKAGLDTRKDKRLTWGKAYSSHLNSRNVSPEFEFHGKVIIITNRMLRTAPDNNPTITQQRILPLLSRVNYFRAGLPSNEWKIHAMEMFAEDYKSKYTEQIYELRCKKNIVIQDSDKMSPPDNFSEKELKEKILREILEYIKDRKDNLREISFRVIANIIEIRNDQPEIWRDMSDSTLGV
jgi:hypothetical protein